MAGPHENRYDDARARRALHEGAVEGLLKWCEMVLGQSARQAPIGPGREQGAPTGTGPGTLRGSGTIEDPEQTALEAVLAGAGGHVWARIVYPLIYAAFQERGMRYDGTYVIHNHPRGGKIHYLSDPVKANAHALPAFMAEGARARLRRELGG